MRLGAMARIEAIKAVRRFGFWATLLALSGLLAVVWGSSYVLAVNRDMDPTHLPGGWLEVAGETGPLAALFGAVLVILLVAAEFGWKTARQNVIDGLSRDEFFVAKLLVVPGVAVVVFLAQVTVGGAVSLMGNVYLDAFAEPLVRGGDLALLGGVLLQILGFLGLAFLSAMIARSSGAAMGIFLLYLALLEQVAGAVLSRGAGWVAEELPRFLPVSVFTAVADPRQWDPELLAAMTERASRAGRPSPEVFETPVLLGAATGWLAVLVVASFLVYRKRDL